MDVVGKLTAKVGPLPAWGWAVVVVGGAGVYLYIRNQTGGTTAIPTAVIDSDPGTVEPNIGGSSGSSGPTDFVPTIGSYSVTTNQQWRAIVSKGLLQSGYPAGKVSHMLTVYLNGEGAPLPADEYDIWEKAIAAYGEPPDAPPPPTKQTVASGGSGTPSSGKHKYAVQRHQTTVATPGADLVRRFSVPDATPNELNQALKLTVNNPANVKYRAKFSGTGIFPPGDYRVTTVQKG